MGIDSKNSYPFLGDIEEGTMKNGQELTENIEYNDFQL